MTSATIPLRSNTVRRIPLSLPQQRLSVGNEATVPTITLVVRSVAVVRLSICAMNYRSLIGFLCFVLKGISYFGSRLETPLPSLLTGFLGWLNGYKSVVEQ